MYTVNDITQSLDMLAPIKTALDWDNVGLLIGDRQKSVQKILVALDCTNEIVDEAEQLAVDIIITHHPIIYDALKTVTTDSPTGKRIIRLIKADISLFTAHTNLDIAKGGVNDVLFNTLELTDKEHLIPPDSDEAGLGRIGSLRTPMPLNEFASFIGQKLNLAHTRFVGDPSTMIYKTGLVCGSGSRCKYFIQAAENGCQAYITGDIKYHDTQAAKDLGLCLIDATHYASEVLIVEHLCTYLRTSFPQADIFAAKFDKQMGGNFEYNN